MDSSITVKRGRPFGNFARFVNTMRPSTGVSCAMAFTPPDGADVKTPIGEDIQANFFIAPYSNIAVVTLDPVSLTVIDRQEAFEHQKMFDPQSGTMDLSVNIAKDILAKEVVNQIGRSVHTALDAPDPRGKSDIKGIREIKAEDVKR